MTDDEKLSQLERSTCVQRFRSACSAVIWLLGVAATAAVAAKTLPSFDVTLWTNREVAFGMMAALFVSLGLWRATSRLREFQLNNRILREFNNAQTSLDQAMLPDQSSDVLALTMNRLKSSDNFLITSLLLVREPYLNELVDARFRNESHRRLRAEYLRFEKEFEKRICERREKLHLWRALTALKSSERHLKQRRVDLAAEWEQTWEGFSWWNKLCQPIKLDFRELDEKLREIVRLKERLLYRHKADLERISDYFADLKTQVSERGLNARLNAERFLDQSRYRNGATQDLLGKAYLFGALSVPASLWSDLDTAGDIYETLRSVNGNYAELSDIEIWWDCLFMPSASLAGLVGLTKGAYLERLVASDTGGELFEHFNNPGSDIVIDGVEYQIKATDSVEYVNSVPDEMAVITTSEVAEITDAIDAGYTNEELEQTVGLALGGEVVDLGDTAVDAILSGVGGLGLFATLSGLNHAVEKHENGGDPVEAIFEGAGVAIEGTARAAVNSMELAYKVVSSRPSRFVGRGLLRAAKALDNKLFNQDA